MEQVNTETSLTKSLTTLIKDELESGIKKYLDISSKKQRQYLSNFVTDNFITWEITKNTLQTFCNKLIVGQWFTYNEFHALYADIKKIKNGEMIQKRIIYQDFIKTPESYLKEIKIILEP